MGKMHGAPLLDQYNGKMSGIRRTHLRKFKLWQYLEINIGIKKLLALIISQTLKKEKRYPNFFSRLSLGFPSVFPYKKRRWALSPAYPSMPKTEIIINGGIKLFPIK